jgi:hypothetical protein
MKRGRLRVSDHAVLRYLERVGGVGEGRVVALEAGFLLFEAQSVPGGWRDLAQLEPQALDLFLARLGLLRPSVAQSFRFAAGVLKAASDDSDKHEQPHRHHEGERPPRQEVLHERWHSTAGWHR